PNQADGDGAGDQPPAEALVGGAIHAAGDDTTKHAPDDRQPVAPEIDDQRGGRADMKEYEEGQKGGIRLVDIPAKERGDEDGVAEAADWKEFRDALQQCQYENLENRHSFL